MVKCWSERTWNANDLAGRSQHATNPLVEPAVQGARAACGGEGGPKVTERLHLARDRHGATPAAAAHLTPSADMGRICVRVDVLGGAGALGVERRELCRGAGEGVQQEAGEQHHGPSCRVGAYPLYSCSRLSLRPR
eukprot:scaffold84123_cov66-Phaeocystis_antarctica.AAC.3